MPRYNLDQISDKVIGQYKPEDFKRSKAWFDEQVKKLGNMVSASSAMNNGARQRATFIPGKMYLYHYFPKGAKELPYYDSLPLVIPFSADNETFTGLNFHYLPYKVRYVLLKNLLDFANNKKLDEKTRLRLAWSYIGGISKYRGVNSAVKKYRFDHVQSNFMEVPSQQWFMSLLLPLEKFNTGPTQKFINKELVWNDSMKFL